MAKKPHKLPLLALLLLLVGFFGPSQGTAVAQSQPPPAAPAPLQVASSPLSVEGRLVPRDFVELSLLASGPLQQLLVSEGDQVPAGAVLLHVGDTEQLEAEIAASEFELLSAQQALDDLHLYAGVDLAEATRQLALVEKRFALAEDKVYSLKKPTSQAILDQAQANLILAENRLDQTEKDIRKVEKRQKNKKGIWWWFLDQKDFRDMLRGLDRARTYAQRRYEDALEKVQDLHNGTDPIDLAQAESDLAVAQAELTEAQRLVDELQHGPDPDQVAAAQSRIRLAEARLAAARSDLDERVLRAPFAGKVVDLPLKVGEWVGPNQPLVVLADDSTWLVETDDLTEIQVPDVQLRQAVTVIPDALPELELAGVVESIDDLFEQKRGDVTYTARIRLEEDDPRLRWGMTVQVLFEG